jgi:competence protein ComEC
MADDVFGETKMRSPMIRIAVAYLGGLLLGAAGRYFPVLAVTAAGVAVLARFRVLPNRRRGRMGAVFTAAVVLFGVVNFSMSERAQEDPLAPSGRERVAMVGQIDTVIRHRPGQTPEDPETAVLGVRLEPGGVREGGSELTGRLRLAVSGFVPDIQYGDHVRIQADPRPITGFRNPGGFDYGETMKRRGFSARAAVRHPEDLVLVRNGGNPVLRKIYRWRERVRAAMNASLSPRAAAVLQAMIIGESGFVPSEVRDEFKTSGTAHLLSISGSHLGLVAFLVFGGTAFMLRRMPPGIFLNLSRRIRARPLAALATVPVAVFYTLLAGAQTATVRSLIMILAYLAAVCLTRRHEPLQALGIAFLIVTIPDPGSVLDISFQLSYGAVLAIILAIRRFSTDLSESPPQPQPVRSRIRSALMLTVAAGLGTAPLVAYHFNQFSWVGLISNPVITPLVGMLVVPTGLFGALWVIVTHSARLPLAGFHEAVVGLLLRAVECFASIPGADRHVPSPPVTVIVLWYAAGCLLLWSGGGPARRQRLAAAACLALTVPWVLGAGDARGPRPLRVTFLDVGQGDSAWVEFPNGRTMLIDGGGRAGSYDAGRLAIAPFLWDRGVRRIDTIVMTHPQVDHAGGLAYLIEKFPVGAFWTNGAGKDAKFYGDILREVGEKNIPFRSVHAGWKPAEGGSAGVEVLHPGDSPESLSDNDRSVVLRIRRGRYSFLFTGDIEAPAESALLRREAPLETTVLKVPHHGSRTSILSRFLEAVCPQTAVISVGRANPFGHPSPEAIEAYGILGSRVFRTDRDGAVTIETDGKRIRYSTYRDTVLLPVSFNGEILAREWENLKKVWRRWVGLAPA